MPIESNNEPLVNVDSVILGIYQPKDDNGNILKGRQFRQEARETADTLLEQNLTPVDVGYLPRIAETNKKLNRIYNRRDKWGKFINWVAARGLSNLDGGDNPHPTPKLPGANTHQIYENLNNGDTQAVRDAVLAQDAFEKEMAPKKAIVAAASATMPIWGRYLWKVLTHPVVEAVGTATGLYNLATDQGVKKTINHYKNGEYDKAILSGFGDMLDASPIFGGIRAIKTGYNTLRAGSGLKSATKTFIDNAPILKFGRILSKENRAKHAFVTINPFGYDKPFQRGLKWVNSVLSDAPVDPNTFKASIEKLSPGIDPKLAKFWNENREDAWRIYNGLEQKYSTYIKNADGTYSYNMPEILRRRPNKNISFMPDANNRFGYDDLGGNHGGLTGRTIIDVGRGKQVHIIEDVWDLHPFSRKGDGLSSRIAKTAITPIGESVIITDAVLDRFQNSGFVGTNKASLFSSKLRDGWINLQTRANNLRLPWDNWFNFEAGNLIGGTPFTMKTIVPTKTIFVPNKGSYLPEMVIDDATDYILPKKPLQLEFNFGNTYNTK